MNKAIPLIETGTSFFALGQNWRVHSQAGPRMGWYASNSQGHLQRFQSKAIFEGIAASHSVCENTNRVYMLKSFEAYGNAGHTRRHESPRHAAMAYFAQFPRSRKCLVGQTDAARQFAWPSVQVTRTTAQSLPDAVEWGASADGFQPVPMNFQAAPRATGAGE